MPPPPSGGLPPGSTRVLLRAEADLEIDNDEAHVDFYAQEQNVDRATAATAVNSRMKDAVAHIKALDPTARVRSGGYSTSPVYAPVPNGGVDRQKVIAWQVRQDVNVTTKKLDGVEKMVAQVQSMKPSAVNVGSVWYGVSRELARSTESKLFDMAFDDLRARIGNVARQMGRDTADFNVDEVNLSGEAGAAPAPLMRTMALKLPAAKSPEVSEPTFEPGTSRQSLSFTAKASIRPANPPPAAPR